MGGSRTRLVDPLHVVERHVDARLGGTTTGQIARDQARSGRSAPAPGRRTIPLQLQGADAEMQGGAAVARGTDWGAVASLPDALGPSLSWTFVKPQRAGALVSALVFYARGGAQVAGNFYLPVRLAKWASVAEAANLRADAIPAGTVPAPVAAATADLGWFSLFEALDGAEMRPLDVVNVGIQRDATNAADTYTGAMLVYALYVEWEES